MQRRWVFALVSATVAIAAAGAAVRFLGVTEEHPATPEDAGTTVPGPVPTATPIPVVWEDHQDRAMGGVGWWLEPKPESAFPPWRGTNAVIYDTQSGRPVDLGEGGLVTFSPDSKYAAWIRGEWHRDSIGFPSIRGDAWVLTLATGDQRRIGPAQSALFVEGDRIALQAPRTPLEDAEWEMFDLATLQRSANQTTEGGEQQETITSTGHILTAKPVAGTEIPRGGYGAGTYQLLDSTDRHVVMEFEAFSVASATATELVVARALRGLPKAPFEPIYVEVYVLDVTTGAAKWIGQAAASSPNWNLSANDKYILWTNNYCSEQGLVGINLIDRASGMPFGYGGTVGSGEHLNVESDEAWVFLTPSGLIAQGTFGPTALIDPATAKYVAVLPKVQLDNSAPIAGWAPVQAAWSPDYRYATYYFAGGHGGLC